MDFSLLLMQTHQKYIIIIIIIITKAKPQEVWKNSLINYFVLYGNLHLKQLFW